MKNKLIKIICVCTLLFSLTGCSPATQVSVNVENVEQLHNVILGKDSFVEIGNGLCYDTATRIIYVKIDGVGGYSYFSAYYAPNGLPYRYNPETNTFEEIEE